MMQNPSSLLLVWEKDAQAFQARLLRVVCSCNGFHVETTQFQALILPCFPQALWPFLEIR